MRRLTRAALRSENDRRAAEWPATPDAQEWTAADKAVELGGEVGEALNVVKKLRREALGHGGSRDTIAHLAEELADVVICTDLLASKYGIDLAAAVIAKFNATSEKMGCRAILPNEE